MKTQIVLASDHAGYSLKQVLIAKLQEANFAVLDAGTFDDLRTDYPDHAHKAANQVANGGAELGLLICGSGNGVNMSANKHKGVRSALAWNVEIAQLARAHNNANMLALPARFIDEDAAWKIVQAFLGAEFEGGRHSDRVNKIEPNPAP